MKHKIKLVSILTLLTYNSLLLADADADFVTIQGAVNHSFVESISKNLAHVGDKRGKYIKVDGNDEFKEVLAEGGFTEDDLKDGSKISKRYISTTIENVDLDDSDLTDINSDTLNLGSEIEGGNVVQSLNIKDTKIETERHINAGVIASGDDTSNISNMTNIEDSQLLGTNNEKDEKDKGISTSKYFD
ncbi:MAG: Unknown protein [uncultured Sulfurovum sp.]|uniref:Uncharacterized protein n=1 Tax=uncultured Sulfurovum sp. TaxID=269237 RepID=A0A6S6TCG6_9BACT|nr:MAG: Unknown protein [uncultured Sulfurovum sp.]